MSLATIVLLAIGTLVLVVPTGLIIAANILSSRISQAEERKHDA